MAGVVFFLPYLVSVYQYCSSHHDGEIRSVTESGFFGFVRNRSKGDLRSSTLGSEPAPSARSGTLRSESDPSVRSAEEVGGSSFGAVTKRFAVN